MELKRFRGQVPEPSKGQGSDPCPGKYDWDKIARQVDDVYRQLSK